MKQYYLRKDILKKILEFSKDREIGVVFKNYFGKRPQTIETIFDIKNFVKEDVLSFHMSQEKWTNALMLKNSTKEIKDKNILGWDLILDLDGVNFKFSKIVAYYIIQYFKELKIENYSIKFSGNKGFHIALPFNAFTNKRIGEVDLRLEFPKIPKLITSLILLNISKKSFKINFKNRKFY